MSTQQLKRKVINFSYYLGYKKTHFLSINKYSTLLEFLVARRDGWTKLIMPDFMF